MFGGAVILECEFDAQELGFLPGAAEVRPVEVRRIRTCPVHIRAVRRRATDVPRKGIRPFGDPSVHAPPREEIQVGESYSR